MTREMLEEYVQGIYVYDGESGGGMEKRKILINSCGGIEYGKRSMI